MPVGLFVLYFVSGIIDNVSGDPTEHKTTPRDRVLTFWLLYCSLHQSQYTTNMTTTYILSTLDGMCTHNNTTMSDNRRNNQTKGDM